MAQSIKQKELNDNILSYLISLDKDEYPNISDLVNNETMANRLIGDIISKMFHNMNISLEDCVDEIEISLSIQ